MTGTNLLWVEDPAHGWLRVPLDELGGYEPTEYSYRSARFAFLEEDCDAAGWARHVGRLDEALAAPVSYADRDARCRRYARFPGEEVAA